MQYSIIVIFKDNSESLSYSFTEENVRDATFNAIVNMIYRGGNKYSNSTMYINLTEVVAVSKRAR